MSSVSSRRAVAYSGSSAACRRGSSSSKVPSHTGRRKQAPMVARRVLGPGVGAAGEKDQPIRPKGVGCAPEGSQIPWVLEVVQHQVPAAGQLRRQGMVGQGTEEKDLLRGLGGGHRPEQVPGTVTCRTVGGIPSTGAAPASHRMVSNVAPHRRASPSILGPSHTIRPWLRRVFRLTVSLRMWVIRGLVLLVMVSMVTP